VSETFLEDARFYDFFLPFNRLSVPLGSLSWFPLLSTRVFQFFPLHGASGGRWTRTCGLLKCVLLYLAHSLASVVIVPGHFFLECCWLFFPFARLWLLFGFFTPSMYWYHLTPKDLQQRSDPVPAVCQSMCGALPPSRFDFFLNHTRDDIGLLVGFSGMSDAPFGYGYSTHCSVLSSDSHRCLSFTEHPKALVRFITIVLLI